jgi:hypothetical protein
MANDRMIERLHEPHIQALKRSFSNLCAQYKEAYALEAAAEAEPVETKTPTQRIMDDIIGRIVELDQVLTNKTAEECAENAGYIKRNFSSFFIGRDYMLSDEITKVWIAIRDGLFTTSSHRVASQDMLRLLQTSTVKKIKQSFAKLCTRYKEAYALEAGIATSEKAGDVEAKEDKWYGTDSKIPVTVNVRNWTFRVSKNNVQIERDKKVQCIISVED